MQKNILRELGIKENFNFDEMYKTYFTLNNAEDIICSYELLILIIKHFYKSNSKDSEEIKKLNYEKLKNILVEEYLQHEYTIPLLVNSYQYSNNEAYRKFLINNDYYETLNNIVIKKYKTKNIDENIEILKNAIDKIIYNDKYYLTYIDICLLAKRFELPIIFITNSVININSIKSIDKIKKFMITNVNKNTTIIIS